MTAVALTLGDTVRLIFKGWPEGHYKTGQPLVLSWNNRSVTMMPGDEKHIPFEMVKMYFGDPRSVNDEVIRTQDDHGNDMIVGDRLSEVIRLKGYWQDSSFRTNNARFREYIPGDRSWLHEQDGRISDLIPDVEVYALNGERIHTVVDDPFGEHTTITTPTRHEQTMLRQQLIEQSDVIMLLKKQNQMLFEKLGIDPETMTSVEDLPRGQDSVMEAPTNPVKKENPKMLYNPRTKKVGPPRKTMPGTDPTNINDLPVDTD